MDVPIQGIKTLAVADFGDLVDTIISDVKGLYNLIHPSHICMYY